MTFLPRLAAIGLLAAAPAFAATTLVDFELPASSSFGSILDYYNGGTDAAGNSGANLGVSFGGDALALINDAADPFSPYFSNAPSPLGVLNPVGPDATMNVGFAFTSISFHYASETLLTDAVQVWSGLNGSGSLLASFNLLANAQAGGCSDTAFCHFDLLAGTFGDARSVTFGGAAGAAIDNISITPVPEPSTYALLALGLAGVVGIARRRRG